MVTNCPNCQKPVRPGAKFCSSCGAILPPQGPPPAPPSPGPPPPGRVNRRLAIIASALIVVFLLGAGLLVSQRGPGVTASPLPTVTPQVIANVRPHEAAQRGLDTLLRSAVVWQEKNNCYGCHVQSFAIMGAAVSKRNKYEVNLSDVTKLASYLVRIQSPGGYITTGQGDFRPTIQTALAGMGLSQYDADVGPEYADSLVRMADWLVGQQTPDGYWQIDHEEPPVDQGEAMMTGCAISISGAAKRHQAKPAYDTGIERGAKWLREMTPQTTQDAVFSVIGLKASGATKDDSDVKRLIELLRKQQHEDGGWGELDTLGSSPYATGQVLYAYKLVGVPIHDDSFRRGVLWLLDQQSADGSWPEMNSQQLNASRKSNYAATMWAVIGLGEVFDVKTEAEFLSLIHPTTTTVSLGSLLAFFALPALVIAPLVWRRSRSRGRKVLRHERDAKGWPQ
jgi:prenyltransferase beta subunit